MVRNVGVVGVLTGAKAELLRCATASLYPPLQPLHKQLTVVDALSLNTIQSRIGHCVDVRLIQRSPLPSQLLFSITAQGSAEVIGDSKMQSDESVRTNLMKTSSFYC